LNFGKRIRLKIDKMVYEGAGLGFYEGKAVFVEGACAGDELIVELVKDNKNFSRGKIVEIIEPSRGRVKPFCPIYNACGGCNWQHLDYEFQLECKLNIVKEALAGLGVEVEEVAKSPEIRGFRHKVQYPVRQTKVSKRVLCGYFKEKSHDITDVKHCPVQALGFDELMAQIRACSSEGKNPYFDAYDEKSGKGLLRHVLVRKSSDSAKMLVVLVLNLAPDASIPCGIKKLAENLYEKFELAGVVINFNNKRTNAILGADYKLLCGEDFLTEKLCGKSFKISAGSFFQVNPHTALEIFNYVKGFIQIGEAVLDAYGGVGAFSVWLSDVAGRVTLCEQAKSAVSDARVNFEQNGVKNGEILEGDCSKELEKLVARGEKFDCVIIDPPRSGSDEKTLSMLEKLTSKRLVYVSCNPMTLARDLKFLTGFGFEAVGAKCFDMFCHTYHVETVVVLEKGRDV